ncbi:MAG: undecaprenyldiphospho-muramoylpentapeptide beta-N-acetylglucosaminyltransferase [Desulfovibrio sp.]|jgi:UDP-N-acetylglucosamine--N-acetylmuramyl-(pentapeptide) pyrophosphoryl-undecaprenol N-acetylglucosamine transferase|nr:undecaprenyldiphospho-muramoylpentapeptide beta-N-acetylglucosaminyltransferase [Desulfovibrio sp.]
MSGLERVILTTGGTGGHIFPALALAGELQKVRPDIDILFMGGGRGPEGELARKAGLEFVALPARGFSRNLACMPALRDMLRSLVQALGHIKKFQPQVVIGFGGYAGFAGVLAARLKGLPTAIHEQNVMPGMSNRILARLARRVFLSLPDAGAFFDARKTELTGNPVRAEIAALHERAKQKLAAPAAPAPGKDAGHILVLGGSQGARALNNALIAMSGKLLDAGLTLTLQTGRDDYERVLAACRELDADRLEIRPFISDMADAYARADLILCRAGASTLAEVCAAGLPSLLVPYPHAAHDHQRLNASALAAAGAARILEQESFATAPDFLAQSLLDMLQDRESLRTMSGGALALARPEAAKSLAGAVLRLYEEDGSSPTFEGAPDA